MLVLICMENLHKRGWVSASDTNSMLNVMLAWADSTRTGDVSLTLTPAGAVGIPYRSMRHLRHVVRMSHQHANRGYIGIPYCLLVNTRHGVGLQRHDGAVSVSQI